MRTPPVPVFQAAPDDPLLCAFEARPAPGAFPEVVLHLRPPGPKAVRRRAEYYYRQLKALPRRLRRTLQRRYARSLAGVALLLALGQAPALAATITVGGGCTLVDAIKAANTDAASGNCPAGGGADTLVLAPNSTHTLTTVQDTTFGPSGLPLVTSEITIAGNNSTIQRVAGAPEFRILAVDETGNLTLQTLTLSEGNSVYVDGVNGSGRGGGVLNRGILTLTNSTVSGNTAQFGGGGVANYNFSTVTLTDSTVSGNSAKYGGGGLYNHGTLTVTNSTVSGNTANNGGGVVNRSLATLTLTNSTVSDNTARIGEGGGVVNSSGTLTVTSSTVSDNTAQFGDGGGVVSNGTLTFTNSTVSGNTAGIGGGMITAGTATLTNSVVSDNTSSGIGGVYNIGTLILTNSTVSGNDGVGVDNTGTLMLVNSTVSGNDGGGVGNGGTATLTNSTVSGNTGSFGSVSNSGRGATLTLTNCTVSDNTGHFKGGGVFNSYGSLTLTNSTVSGNTAGERGGGGVYNTFRGSLTLTRSLISGNTAANGQEVSNYTIPYDVGTVHADNFNLFGVNGDAGVVGFTPGPTDIVPPAGVTLADILAPLADNGGPTQTHALVEGSPAIDASPIDKDCAATDQRGVFRPQGAACDIGAFEAGVEPDPFALPTPTSGCTVNGVPDQLCRGTSGPDRIIGTTGNDVILGLEGDDHLNSSRGDDRLFGGEDNDRLIGSKGDDQLFGQTGDDDLRGFAGDDVLEGGDGNDRLKGHEGNDQLRGGNGDDALRGLEGQDTLEGGAGSDLLRGGADSDDLNGGPGADRLVGGGGTDRCTSDAEDKLVVLCE